MKYDKPMGKYERRRWEWYTNRFLGAITDRVINVLDFRTIQKENCKVTRVEMLMEYGGSSLDSYLTKVKKVDEGRAQDIMYQLINVLALLEELGVSHMDLKPQNILWDEDKSFLRLIDFGISIVFLENPEDIKAPLGDFKHRFVGFTETYSPPELLANLTKWEIKLVLIPQKVDIFSFGIIFAEILLGSDELPMRRDNTAKEHENFLKELQNKLFNAKSKVWVPFIMKCLQYSPTERPTFASAKVEFESILLQYTLQAKMIMQEQNRWLLKHEIDYKNANASMDVRLWVESFLLEYYARMLSTLPYEETTKSHALLFYALGCAYMEQIIPNEKAALECFEKSHTIYKGLYGENIVEIVNVILKKSEVCSNNFLKMAYLYEALNETYKLSEGKEILALLTKVNIQIASITVDTKQYEVALSNYATICDYLEKTCKWNDPQLAEIYKNIGGVYLKMGDEFKHVALDYYLKSLVIFEDICADCDYERKAMNEEIGRILYELGDLETAEKYLEEGGGVGGDLSFFTRLRQRQLLTTLIHTVYLRVMVPL
eukprot:TRINITY_DN17_c4_g1_i14.p1 TRINITY_DN17_c4_g1~~TRINITY_DN17_c4_g1_i14.p1  ORF type:complete len:545 (-),score=42.97 TRINITY_DN17_c4_g1_i14:194-1828(-)